MKLRAFGSGFESLEDRTLLAGNVAISVAGTVLNVNGDAASNVVEAIQGANGDITVIGLAGTTINGKHSVVFHAADLSAAGVTSIVANGNNGNDTLILDGLTFAGSVSINGNAGDDTTTIVNCKFGDLSINAGDGTNVNTIVATKIANSLSISGGSGTDIVGIVCTNVGQSTFISLGNGTNVTGITSSDFGASMPLSTGGTVLSISGGTGTDVLAMNFVTTHNAETDIFLGDGNNVMSLLNSKFETELEFNTGSGNDVIVLINDQTNELDDSSTGAGNDYVLMQNVNVVAGPSDDSNLFGLDLGDGNDVLAIVGSSFAGTTNLTGGIGNDVIAIAGSKFTGSANINMGAGDDLLSVVANNFVAGGLFDGGGGNDSLFSRANSGITPVRTGFSHIL